MPYVVLRKPVLPEDEGRHELVAVVDTEAEAKDAIEAATHHGYFFPYDYVILHTP